MAKRSKSLALYGKKYEHQKEFATRYWGRKQQAYYVGNKNKNKRRKERIRKERKTKERKTEDKEK